MPQCLRNGGGRHVQQTVLCEAARCGGHPPPYCVSSSAKEARAEGTACLQALPNHELQWPVGERTAPVACATYSRYGLVVLYELVWPRPQRVLLPQSSQRTLR
eukprot:2066-Chlamydomonas_euryale.AAC.1